MSLNNNQNNKRLDVYDTSSSASFLNVNLNNGGNGSSSFRSGSTKESNVSIKSLFKESTNSGSQRSGSASSLIKNLNNDLSSSNGLITTLLRLNQHR